MQHFSYAMSAANAQMTAASWLEGFLKGSGTLLLLDEELWYVVDNWVSNLEEEMFMQVLPLLRRTFANFSPPERKKIGEKAKSGGVTGAQQSVSEAGFDTERAKLGLPVMMELLGLKFNVINNGA
jgi:hypothetical protein